MKEKIEVGNAANTPMDKSGNTDERYPEADVNARKTEKVGA
jgi:hypothetical protein